jgi:hypothetical protein
VVGVTGSRLATRGLGRQSLGPPEGGR